MSSQGTSKENISNISAEDFLELCDVGSEQEVLDAIRAGANVNSERSYTLTPLMVAIMRDDEDDTPCEEQREQPRGNTLEVVRVLLNAGADIEAQDDDGCTALMYAAAGKEKIDIMKALLDAGADVEVEDECGYTALLTAIDENNVEGVRILIAAGADVNKRTELGYRALSFAAPLNDVDAVRILLDAGADINAKDYGGQTALILAACHNDNHEVIELLLNAGADVNVKDSRGKTAFDYAKENADLKDRYLLKRLEINP